MCMILLIRLAISTEVVPEKSYIDTMRLVTPASTEEFYFQDDSYTTDSWYDDWDMDHPTGYTTYFDILNPNP